jgi:hypothetical protein
MDSPRSRPDGEFRDATDDIDLDVLEGIASLHHGQGLRFSEF